MTLVLNVPKQFLENPEQFLKKQNSRRQFISKELNRLRKLNRDLILPEVLPCIDRYVEQLQYELKRITKSEQSQAVR